jgi:hypothetical protein
MRFLQIVYADPQNLKDTFELKFQLLDSSIVGRWIDCLQRAQPAYPIDDPGRFYGFGSIDYQIQDSIKRINNCINIINSDEPIIDRYLSTVDDQDTLNYLHHIFEVYHGLLDQQNHKFWLKSSITVRKVLAELNVLVHRCESVQRSAKPRHVVTYYGLPKTQLLNDSDYDHFTDNYQFGTVYLNYVEIGKTLEDLAIDNDQYIEDSAFQPFRHFSADFNVKFWDENPTLIDIKHAKIKEYYDNREKFFNERNLYWGHPWLKSGSIPVAKLETNISRDELLDNIDKRQWIKEVNLI